MAPPSRSRRQRRATCQICEEAESKYTCAKCAVLYCSVSCYKQHKSFGDNGKNSSVCADAEAPPPPPPAPPRSTSPRAAHDNPPLPPPPLSPPLALAGDSDRTSIAPDARAQARVPAASRGSSSSSSSSTAAQEDHPLAGPSASSASPAGPIPLAASSESEPNPASGPGHHDAPSETPSSGVTGSTNELELELELDGARSHAATVRQLSTGGSSESPASHSPSPSPSHPHVSPDGTAGPANDAALADPRPLRKLTTLNWPYVPDEPSYPDPLKRDDPKALNLAQYEAIATSPSIRHALSAHPRLPALLASLDQLRGAARADALERVLGVSPAQSAGFALAGLPSSSSFSFSTSRADSDIDIDMHSEEDMRALRALAEAVEGAVRGERADVLGLDWEGTAG